jgi:hypothetical protein
MKTRTLLLLALVCGLAIMMAGAVFLFQLTGQDDVAEPVAIGASAHVGDLTVVVLGASEADGVLDVMIDIGGVEDPDGATGFRLIASGRPITQTPSGVGGCVSTTVVAQRCIIRFDVSTADGVSRVLLYARGDSQARWVIA